ncbi:hypothetical protein BJ508DRAFT_332187 [Ascobolus immersus RN42]|uniref:Transglutaminase-like domain-containing protein n=1 Tax=Ascobolus immersus RN42 TaxID=1160509 RepID=A0A3N4HSA8_ASCIM|nr:hypothetical protein BJ508DRAFT_332187 [Ascobolus immersus RN42]
MHLTHLQTLGSLHHIDFTKIDALIKSRSYAHINLHYLKLHAIVVTRDGQIPSSWIDHIGKQLCKRHPLTRLEKYRIISIWLAQNVRYKDVPPQKNEIPCLSQMPEKVVNSRRANCVGFSVLYKRLCNAAGLPCRVEYGIVYVLDPSSGRVIRKESHAWNSIEIPGGCGRKFVDVTWCVGSKKRYNEEWFRKSMGDMEKTHRLWRGDKARQLCKAFGKKHSAFWAFSVEWW